MFDSLWQLTRDRSALLCPPLAAHSDIAGMLLKSTGDFLDAGLQKSGDEFWESADDSTASDEIRSAGLCSTTVFRSVEDMADLDMHKSVVRKL